MAPVIRVQQLGKRYRLGGTSTSYTRLTEDLTYRVQRLLTRENAREDAPPQEIWALRDITFDVGAGEVVGIVGRNGAGKTTLLKVLSRITAPTAGRAVVNGRVGSLLEVGTGFHGELSGRENVFLNGAILGMQRREIEAKFDDIVEFSGVERFIDTPVKRYSSGMAVRLAFSVAAFLEPEILFIDEVLSVGDQAFQQRCLGRMGDIARSGRTILFVSHNLAAVTALCSRAILIDAGQVVRDGAVEDVIGHYLSTVQTNVGESVEERLDRQGDGRLRVVRVEVVSATGGPPRTGVDAVVRLRYRTSAPGSAVAVGIAVEGPLGEPVCQCSSKISGDTLVSETDEGELLCELGELPLLPGRYSLSFRAEVSGIVADWLRSALYFDVFESDVFGTGRLPATTHGRVLVKHHWRIHPDTNSGVLSP